MTANRDSDGRLLRNGVPVTGDQLLWEANSASPPDPAADPPVSLLDQCRVAAISGIVDPPRLTIPPLVLDVLILLAGILIGAGVFHPGL